MIDRSKLLSISDLKLSSRIDGMDQNQLESYAALLDSFIDSLPQRAGRINTDLAEKNYLFASQELRALKEMLDGICADDMSVECQRQTDGLKNGSHEDAEAGISKFISSLTTLSIILQVTDYKVKDAAESLPPIKLTRHDDGRIHILAVDDASFFLNALKRHLDDPMFKLVLLSSGLEALGYLEKNRPDLFILDIEMPNMDGYELAGKIKAKGHTAPIIFLTGSSDRSSVVKAVKAGAAEFIVKPSDKESILKKIGKFL